MFLPDRLEKAQLHSIEQLAQPDGIDGGGFVIKQFHRVEAAGGGIQKALSGKNIEAI